VPSNRSRHLDFGFWVHVICACSSNKVTFVNHKTIEPVDSILKIDPASFIDEGIYGKHSNVNLYFLLFVKK
jgi:hypothetical protein